MDKQPGFLTRFFTTLWRAFNTTRKVILNLIFFGFLFAFIIVLTHDKEMVIVPDHSALVLNLVGDIVEQKHEIKPLDQFFNEMVAQKEQRPEILLSDILDVLASAKNDDRVKILVLNLSQLQRSGLTKLRIVAKALEDFKQSGKQVIAAGDSYSQNQYYLASYADEVWMNPKGWLLLDGYGHYPLYFKSALEKLKVSQHIFRVGTYKSAVEPYIRDDMSEAAKEANQAWLQELWQQYKSDVAEQRHFDVDNFDDDSAVLVKKLGQAQGNIADYALNNHWVDALKTRDDMRNSLVDLVGKNEKGNSFRQIGFEQYLAAINHPSLSFGKKHADSKVAIIVAKGTILDGEQAPGNIGGDSTAQLLRQARNNDQVKAVVLRVDSPGGSAYASEIIRQEVELLKKAGKPVVASMGTYAASGGYWISAAADTIVAEPTTITGSIGIFGMLMTFENTLSELGVHTDGVGTTDIAGFNITRPMSDDMKQLFQLTINRGYQDFIHLVAENRDMTPEQVDAIAQGRVWTGAKAQELGLVDQLGDMEDAVKIAAEQAELTNYETLLIEKEMSPRDKLLRSLLTEDSKALLKTAATSDNLSFARIDSKGPITELVSMLKTEYKQLDLFNDPQGIYTFCLPCQLN